MRLIRRLTLQRSSRPAVSWPTGASGNRTRRRYPAVAARLGDDFGSFPGDYAKLVPVGAANDQLHSSATLGEIILGVTPGLLEVPSEANFVCINTNGYVQVPWAEELNTPQFTLEAWVSPTPG